MEITDTYMLDTLASNYWKLEPFDMPTGEGDADVGWRVIEYYQAPPCERVVAEVFEDDPRKALAAAVEKHER